MSQARVKTSVFAARKGATLVCEVGGHPILKGETYKWYRVGFRSRLKHVRCMRPEHAPRPSQLESSMLADAYSAVEDAEANLSALGTVAPEDNVDSIKTELEAAAEGIRGVAEQYRDAANSMGGAGADNEERADTLESSADELDSTNLDEEPDFDSCDNEAHNGPGDEPPGPGLARGDDGCESCVEIKQNWWDGQIEEAQGAIGNIEWP